jgi:uncharacterized protein YegJ (DUF2314 family)
MRTVIIIASFSVLTSIALAETSAPPDIPVRVQSPAEVAAYDRAIAPYVAKARASYPAAKKRFLAGLPPKHTFAVQVRLRQKDEKARAYRFEDVFVGVQAIKKGTVYGWINSKPMNITNHHQGEQIQFPESEVMNWLIVRPDGSEEGNYLGKFLDHWKPPKA